MKVYVGWRRFLFCFPLIFILPHLFSVLELHQNQAVTDAPKENIQKFDVQNSSAPKKATKKFDHLVLGPAAGEGLPNRLQCQDTSFLEFCLKQSRSEAEIFLVENLGSFDPNREFIEKFLNYKELLPADVLEIAFERRNDGKLTELGSRNVNSNNTNVADFDQDVGVGPDGSSKAGGKKKGKKGNKISSAVLGFNVVSNRIMMGEIQTVED